MKIKKTIVVALVASFQLHGMDFKTLNESGRATPLKPRSSVEKTAVHENFRQTYTKEFNRIWNNTAYNKKKYAAELKKTYQNLAIVNKSFDEYVLDLMRDAYKDTLKTFYPNDPLLQPVKHFRLRDEADREVRNYIENDTCCGCCWLLCSGVTR